MKDPDDDNDDSMLKVTTLKKTLFFLALLSDPPQRGPALSAPLQAFAQELSQELAVEINNCLHMRSVLHALIEALGENRVLALLDDSPVVIEEIATLAQKWTSKTKKKLR
jgi:ribonuclease HI